MFLVPEEDTGFFVVQNADDGCVMIADLSDQLMDRYYPAPTAIVAPLPPVDFDTRADQYVGIYRFNQYFHSKVQKLAILEWQELPKVTAPGDGTLEFYYTGAPDEVPFKYVEIGPHLFAQVNRLERGGGHVKFLTDSSGQVTAFSWGSEYFFEKVRWYERVGVHKALFAFYAAVFLLAAVLGAVALFRRQGPWPAVGVVALTGLLNALAIGGMFALLNLDPDLADRIFSYARYPLPVVVLACALLLTTVLSVLAIPLAIWLWRKRVWTAAGRVAYTGFALIAVGFIPFLSYWNLLSFRW
jgi:hypothetical protein